MQEPDVRPESNANFPIEKCIDAIATSETLDDQQRLSMEQMHSWEVSAVASASATPSIQPQSFVKEEQFEAYECEWDSGSALLEDSNCPLDYEDEYPNDYDIEFESPSTSASILQVIFLL